MAETQRIDENDVKQFAAFALMGLIARVAHNTRLDKVGVVREALDLGEAMAREAAARCAKYRSE